MACMWPVCTAGCTGNAWGPRQGSWESYPLKASLHSHIRCWECLASLPRSKVLLSRFRYCIAETSLKYNSSLAPSVNVKLLLYSTKPYTINTHGWPFSVLSWQDSCKPNWMAANTNRISYPKFNLPSSCRSSNTPRLCSFWTIKSHCSNSMTQLVQKNLSMSRISHSSSMEACNGSAASSYRYW